MPLYEYQCELCGVRFERLVWSSDAAAGATVRCGCGSASVQRIPYSRVAVSTSGRDSFAADAGGCHGDDCGAGEDCGAGSGCCGGGMCGMN